MPDIAADAPTVVVTDAVTSRRIAPAAAPLDPVPPAPSSGGGSLNTGLN